MTLILRVRANGGSTPSLQASFSGAAPGTVGRGADNTLVLPDPERRISRRQAEIASSAGGFVISNIGSGNAVNVGGRDLAPGESAPLRAGDSLQIGSYAIDVDAAGADADERTAFSADFMSGSSASGGASAGTPSDRRGHDPFADLLAPPSPAAPPASRAAGPAERSPTARLPDDFDPFALPSQAPAAQPAAASASAAPGAFDDLIPSSTSASVDPFFGLTSGPSARADPLADFLSDFRPNVDAKQGEPPLSSDPMALFGVPSEARRPPAETPHDGTAELRGAFVPPRPLPPQAPTPAPVAAAVVRPDPGGRSPKAPSPSESAASAAARAAPPPPGWTPDAIAVWNALCEGAGVRLAPPANTGPQFLRVVGMIMRAAVEGTVQLMAVRHATRQELHAQVTQIQPKNNNPLKFAPDGLSALEQLLQPAVRGFLPGPAAMTDAMNDLLGHAIGTMAGTRAALEGVLGRFAPEQLEAKLSGKSVLDNLVPAARKAKLWDLYLLHYEALRDEAQEDFHALFGKAFLAAYEQQLDRLKREKAAAAARGAPSR